MPRTVRVTRYRREVNWSTYASFLVFATVLILIPGADFTVVVKNTLTGGARRGRWTSLGVASSNVLQGVAAVAGLGAVVVRFEPLFEAVKWAGLAYLAYLAAQSFRSAWCGRYEPAPDGATLAGGRRYRLAGWRQGFLSNVTNPKVLVFYLAVLPQFVSRSAAPPVLLAYALSHAVLGLLYLLLVVAGLNRIRAVLARRRVRRALDAGTGAVLLGFGARLAVEQA
jgi:threonine/homoserine/homoserine lactone efflux protein